MAVFLGGEWIKVAIPPHDPGDLAPRQLLDCGVPETATFGHLCQSHGSSARNSRNKTSYGVSSTTNHGKPAEIATLHMYLSAS